MLTSLGAKAERPRQILVGPNILVSRDGDFPHIEYAIAANPAKANEFIAAAMTLSGPGRSIGVRAYTSEDGGNTWNFHHFPELERGVGNGSGDPQVAFGPTGTAYLLALTDEFGEHGEEVPQRLYVYRSKDAGRTWLSPLRLSTCDRPSLAIDLGHSKFRGRIYVSVLYTKNHQQTLGLFHSDDDGQTFVGPRDVVRASGAQVAPPLVLSDGTLVFPYVEWEMGTEGKFESTRAIKVVISTDGGETFSSPHQIAMQSSPGERLIDHFRERLSSQPSKPRIPHLGGANFDWPAIPQFANNPRCETFRDRIFAVWNETEAQDEGEQLLFSYSSDHGRNWSRPVPVNPVGSEHFYQFTPAMRVSDQGVVGVQWFDSRNSPQQSAYDLYFTASLDGGASFLPAVRVTSQSSVPSVASHIAPNLEDNAFREDTFQLLFASIESTRGAGDYMGLTTDASGTFYPLWADGRYGSFQMMTARIEIGTSAEAPAENRGLARKLGAKDVRLVLDPVHYDMTNHRFLVPVRLRNISGSDLLQPMRVTVKSVESGFRGLLGAGFEPPRILNASNGRPGSGAVFDYSHSTGHFSALRPGEVSEAVTWEFQMENPGQAVFDIQAEISGGTP